MTSHGLAQAIETLLGNVGEPIFDTDVPGSQGLPWVVYSIGLPRVSERSVGHQPIARVARLMVKYVSGSAQYCRTMADAGDAALEGARLTVEGWTLGPLGLINTRDPQADYEVTTTAGARPVVAISEYVFTAVRSA